jgi:hypothetical protein
MSHIARVKCKIKNATQENMRETLDFVLGVLPNARIETHVTSDMESRTDCDVSIFSDHLTRGIGINWKNGDFELLGDQMEQGAAFQEAQDLIITTYQNVATQRAMKQVGFKVGAPEVMGSTAVRLKGTQAVGA